jgi:hypothetical protein
VVQAALGAGVIATARSGAPSLREQVLLAYRWLRLHVTDAWWIAIIAGCVSVGVYAWYESRGLTILFNDAGSRELIARRVLVSRTPGLAQLGSTWLPLPGLLMLPLIWSNTLFRDGIAGSIPSMLAYVLAASYTYRLARLATSSRPAGWLAAVILMANPSVLYMQTTAMSETISLCAFVAALYYALALAKSHQAADIVKCATAVACGTLVRYDDWAIAFALIPVLIWIGWKEGGRIVAEAWVILYSLLAFTGCVAWVIYNAVIFHDPLLSFFYGQSNHKYYPNTPDRLLPGRGHPLVAIKMYGLSVTGTVGWPLVGLAVAGLSVGIWKMRRQEAVLPLLLALLPFVFYCLVFYLGINTESLPQLGTGTYYNVRFGLAMVPAVALFVGFVAVVGSSRMAKGISAILLVPVVAWGFWGSTHQTPFVEREAIYGNATIRSQGQEQANWFAENYHGGTILLNYLDSSEMVFYLMTDHGVSDRAFLSDANGAQFAAALAHPEKSVTWIVLSMNLQDGVNPIRTELMRSSGWRSSFALRRTFGPIQIYERLGRVAASLKAPAG